MNNEVQNIDWSSICNLNSPCEQVNFLESNLIYLYEKYVPVKTKNVINSKSLWFTKKIEILIEQRNLAYNRWKQFKTAYLHEKFKELRRNTNIDIKTVKNNYYSYRFFFFFSI